MENRGLKILHIVTDDSAKDEVGKILDLLDADGIEQSVVAPKGTALNALLARKKMPLDSAPLSWPFAAAQRYMLARAIGQMDPDIVQCWSRRAAALLPYDLQKSRAVVGWAANLDHPYYYRTCGHLVGIARPIVDHAARNGMAAPYVHYIPTFPALSPTASVSRTALSTPRDARVLVSLSKLYPHKGLDSLIDALARLPENYWLWIAGDGPSRRALELQARESGVLDRVRFLGWRDDRAALLRAADLCIVPARRDLSGSVILEAWATGTPVIACANDGAKAMIEPDATGLLTPIDNPAALADAILRLAADDTLRRRIIAQGYAAYTKDYTREAAAHRWRALYEALTAVTRKED